jgi:hypothetical protein
LAYADRLPLLWVAEDFSETDTAWARDCGPMTLLHANIKTTSRYLTDLADDTAAVAEILDRHHQALRRQRILA